MLMIKPLERIVINNSEDGIQTSRLPNNEEMMNKINEIVNCINHLNKEKQDKPIQGFGTRTSL